MRQVQETKKQQRGETVGDDVGKGEVPNMGNGAGDDFGKSLQENWKSTNWFLGDELEKRAGDEYGKRGSPGFCCLLR